MVVLAAYRRMFARLADLFKSDRRRRPEPLRRGLYSRLMLEPLGWSRNWLSLLSAGRLPVGRHARSLDLLDRVGSPPQGAVG